MVPKEERRPLAIDSNCRWPEKGERGRPQAIDWPTVIGQKRRERNQQLLKKGRG